MWTPDSESAHPSGIANMLDVHREGITAGASHLHTGRTPTRASSAPVQHTLVLGRSDALCKPPYRPRPALLLASHATELCGEFECRLACC